MGVVWAREEGEIRNYAAKGVYFLTPLTLLLNSPPSYHSLFLCLLKPLLLLSGPENALPLLLLITQLLALSSFLAQHRRQINTTMISMLLYLTMIQYFYRTSHRERFSSLQFAKAFVGFTQFNYYLHGVLVIINTYTAQIIGMMMVPVVVARIKEGRKVGEEEGEEKEK